MKRILFSDHANKRMGERRQNDIEYEDVYAACNLAKEILFKGVPMKIKLLGFTAKSGVKFDMVVMDEKLKSGEVVLLVITVIGTQFDKKSGRDIHNYYRVNGVRLNPNIPYKKRRKIIRRMKKKERKYIDEPIPKYRKDVSNTEESRQAN
jgi:hypothetical protein